MRTSENLGKELEKLRQTAVNDLDQLIQHRYEPNFQRFVDSLTAYIIARTEHDDASRHDPAGLM